MYCLLYNISTDLCKTNEYTKEILAYGNRLRSTHCRELFETMQTCLLKLKSDDNVKNINNLLYFLVFPSKAVAESPVSLTSLHNDVSNSKFLKKEFTFFFFLDMWFPPSYILRMRSDLKKKN